MELSLVYWFYNHLAKSDVIDIHGKREFYFILCFPFALLLRLQFWVKQAIQESLSVLVPCAPRYWHAGPVPIRWREALLSSSGRVQPQYFHAQWSSFLPSPLLSYVPRPVVERAYSVAHSLPPCQTITLALFHSLEKRKLKPFIRFW